MANSWMPRADWVIVSVTKDSGLNTPIGVFPKEINLIKLFKSVFLISKLTIGTKT
jgi:hypothetical protein